MANDISKIKTPDGVVHDLKALSVKDSGNGTATTFAYSKAALTSTTWLAAWNGYELRGILPANITAGKASSVDWSGVQSPPTTLSGYGITDAVPFKGKNSGNTAQLARYNSLTQRFEGSVSSHFMVTIPANTNWIEFSIELSLHDYNNTKLRYSKIYVSALHNNTSPFTLQRLTATVSGVANENVSNLSAIKVYGKTESNGNVILYIGGDTSWKVLSVDNMLVADGNVNYDLSAVTISNYTTLPSDAVAATMQYNYNPMTAANDLIIGGGNGKPECLAKGSNGTFLMINSSGNVAWSAISLATGDSNGQVKIAGTNVSVKGLAELAYTHNRLFTTNPFAGDRGSSSLYISKIDNGLYRASDRYDVTATIGGTAQPAYLVAQLFDGSYETSMDIRNGQTAIITIDTTNKPWQGAYPYGTIYLSFYHVCKPTSVSCRIYNTYSSQGAGWHDVACTKIVDGTSTHMYSIPQNYYQPKKIEITIVGDTTNEYGYTALTQIEMWLQRPSPQYTPFVNKYYPETLYSSLTVTNTSAQAAGIWFHGVNVYAPSAYAGGNNGSNGNVVGFQVGKEDSARNCGYLGFHYWGPSGSYSNCLTLGLHSADHIITANGYRRVGINTINPQYDLDVNGTVNASSSIKVNGTSVSLEGHTHSYLPLSGGALTGDVTLATGKTIRPAAATNSCSLGTASYPWNYVHTKGISINDAGEVSLPFEGDGFLKYDQDSRLYLDNTAYATASHAHGNMTSAGAVTATATIASGDRILITDSSASSKACASGITFGTGTGTFLNNKGEWGTPGGTNAGHTHTLKITTVQGTNVTDLLSNTTYKLVVGNASYQFKTPTDYTCLAEGTKILMADNSEKNIEDVVAGDVIMSYDPNTEKLCEAVIIDNIHTGRSDDYVNYYFDDGSFLSIFGKHCIYSADEGTARGVDYWEPGWKTIAADGKEVMYIGSENVHNAGRKRHFDLHSSNKLYFANGILNAQSLTLDYPMYKDEGLPEEFITALKADFDSSANLHTHQFDKKTGSILAPILKELKAQKKVMDDNKKRLADSDYLVAKFTEGLISAAEWLKAKAERAGWRSAVNKAEPLYAAAEERYKAFKAKYAPTNTKRERFNAAVARDNACLDALKAYYKSKNELSK